MKYGTYYPQDTGSLVGSHLSQLLIRVATANLRRIPFSMWFALLKLHHTLLTILTTAIIELYSPCLEDKLLQLFYSEKQ